MAPYWMSDDLEWIWKGAVVASSRCYKHLLGETENTPVSGPRFEPSSYRIQVQMVTATVQFCIEHSLFVNKKIWRSLDNVVGVATAYRLDEFESR